MELWGQEIPDDLYVVVIENDAGRFSSEDNPGKIISWKTPLKNATLEKTRKQLSEIIHTCYGRARIAKLTFIEE